jgi:hypothetical protein
LEFLFQPLECLEKGYDLSERRKDYAGFWKNGKDSVPIDALGGFRENWASYSVHRKGPGPAVPQFKNTEHPMARYLRQDTQGMITNPELLGLPAKPPEPTANQRQLSALSRQLTAVDRRLAEVNRKVSANAPLALRAYRGVRRRLRQRLAN